MTFDDEKMLHDEQQEQRKTSKISLDLVQHDASFGYLGGGGGGGGCSTIYILNKDARTSHIHMRRSLGELCMVRYGIS